MAKPAKPTDGSFNDVNEKQKKKEAAAAKDAEGHGVAAIRGNGYDKEATAGFVERIENLNARKESLHMDYMRECAEIAKDKNEVLDEAKDAGLKKKSIRAVVKKHDLERKIEAIRENMEDDDADDYDQVLQALGELGDTPLGAAALSKTKNGASEQPGA